jgi:Ca2+-binding EF-hand superfamily protein
MQTSKNNSFKVEVQLKEMFNCIDINGDGTISFEEFCKMMKNIIKS